MDLYILYVLCDSPLCDAYRHQLSLRHVKIRTSNIQAGRNDIWSQHFIFYFVTFFWYNIVFSAQVEKQITKSQMIELRKYRKKRIFWSVGLIRCGCFLYGNQYLKKFRVSYLIYLLVLINEQFLSITNLSFLSVFVAVNYSTKSRS